MVSKKKQQEAAAARRARLEELRRADRARDRRVKALMITAVVAVLGATLGGGWYLLSAAEREEAALAGPVKGERTWEKLSRDHVQEDVDYPMTPAAGGDHDQAWANCDSVVYTKEIREENAVHSLEHGAVWISYNGKAAEGDVKKLTQRVETTPYTFISPLESQDASIALTAWGRQLTVDDAADPRIDRFLEKYVQGEQTPEPGAACTGGVQA